MVFGRTTRSLASNFRMGLLGRVRRAVGRARKMGFIGGLETELRKGRPVMSIAVFIRPSLAIVRDRSVAIGVRSGLHGFRGVRRARIRMRPR